MLCYVLFFLLFSFQIQIMHSKPNFVIIMADDMGWNDVSFHGANQIPTPNIDALAYSGIILNRFYTQHSCTPSRAALLTGNYPMRVGLQQEPLSVGENYSLAIDATLLPQKLKELGYANYLVGKWHLGHHYKSVTPTRRGFDKYFGYWNAYVSYFDYITYKVKNMTGFDLRENFNAAWDYQGQYATQLFTNKAIEFIKGHDTKKPMFLMVSHLAVHTGPDLKVEVKNITETNEKFNYIKNQERRIYAGAIEELDKSVGEILEALSNKNMLNDTLILFLSDNGAPTVGQYANQGSNWPFRGIKMFYFEGGVRSTAVLWGSQLNKNVINNDLFHISDIMPTFYAAAGGNVSDLGTIDGINQWDMLSKNASAPRTEILVNINEGKGTAAYISKKGQYKLVNGSYSSFDNYYGESGRQKEGPEYNLTEILESKVHQALQEVSNAALSENMILKTRSELDLSWCRLDSEKPNITCDSFCLFDLFNDPCEKNDIKDQQEDLVEEMKTKIKNYWSQLVPQPAKYIDPRSNPIYFNNTWDTWLNQFCLPNDSNPLCA